LQGGSALSKIAEALSLARQSYTAGVLGMADIPRDDEGKPRRRDPERDYRFDFITYCLLAIAVLWAVVEIARRHL
jgi:hypothetical protein